MPVLIQIMLDSVQYTSKLKASPLYCKLATTLSYFPFGN